MDVDEFVEELDAQGAALAAAAGAAGLAADVPTCPGWTVRHLLQHLGKVHRWAATYVRDGRDAYGGKSPRLAKPPAEGLLDWFVEGHAELVRVLRKAPADLDCWAFLPAPSPLAFWARRQAHETAIHRADADSALGAVPSFPAAFAADGLDELLTGFFSRRGGSLVADPPRSLTVAPTDADRGWHLIIKPDGRQVSTDVDQPADCTVRGSSSDLYLLLWNRIPAQQPEVSGDPDVLQLWQERAQIKWR